MNGHDTEIQKGNLPVQDKPQPSYIINNKHGITTLDETIMFIVHSQHQEIFSNFRFLFNSTGSNKNWSYKRFNYNNKLVNQITPVNADHALDQFHKPFFEWNYKAINYDLNRSFAYRNLIALILHHIWIWICNQLYNQEKEDISTLDYELILKKVIIDKFI
ncbi:hypothetical protein ACTA71_004222 [Dictyostelium dimigraforme]